MNLKKAVLALLLSSLTAFAQSPIRLKSRVFTPNAGSGVQRPQVRPDGAVRRAHYILQFDSTPGPETLARLAERNIQVMSYVPDSALMVSSSVTADLSGLGATWTGTLEASDKLSAELSAPSPAYLVYFYPDVAWSDIRRIIHASGFNVLPNARLLAGHAVVTGPPERLEGLAAHDEVAYVMPASPDLANGEPLTGCNGALSSAGIVAEYSTVGRGWSKDSSGVASLLYNYQSLTTKIDAYSVRSEIERAMREWTRYANVSFVESGGATSMRSVSIRFASGSHGDGYAFDGAGGVLAHTFYPAPPNAEPIAGDMHFDAAEPWRVGASTDLYSVALHELGHALGLGHSGKPGTVMYPYYRLATGLTADDIAGAQSLYGAPTDSSPSTPASPDGPGTPTTPTSPSNPPTEPVTPTNPTSPGGTADATPPSLRITSPGYTIVSTSSSTISISGTANDNVGVASVKWSTSTGGSGAASGTTAWSASVGLLRGTNVVTVRAYDAAGNMSWRSLTVVRR